MISVAIISFLIGAVLAWAFRVWILVPISLIAVAAAVTAELTQDGTFASLLGHVLLIGALPQLGYCFGLFTRHTLVMVRAPLTNRSRNAAVALLFNRRPSK